MVEQPITAYLPWELHLLRVHAECGELIRVIGLERVAALEQDSPLPELITLGRNTVYGISYDASGPADGAVRYQDP